MSAIPTLRLRLVPPLFAGLAVCLAGSPVSAQPGPHSSAPRVPDRVWSTQPSSAIVVPPPPTGVVVMTPQVVLGWGGLPPSGPVATPGPMPPHLRPGLRHGGPMLPMPAPGSGHAPAVSGQGTLHTWRTP